MLLMQLSYWVNSLLYNTKTLGNLRWFSMLVQLFFYLAALYIYALHYQNLYSTLGTLMTATVGPYLLVAVGVTVVFLLQKEFRHAGLALLFGFLPSAMITEDGIVALMLIAMGYGIHLMEKSHRQYVVKIVSLFSEEFSPLYAKRRENGKKYPEYARAYRELDLIDLTQFTFLKEVEVTERNKKTGLVEKNLYRTFKIKGVPGKTTIKDGLFIAPQRRPFPLIGRSI